MCDAIKNKLKSVSRITGIITVKIALGQSILHMLIGNVNGSHC